MAWENVLHGQWCVAGMSVLSHMHTPPGICSSSCGNSSISPFLTQRWLFFSSRIGFGIFSSHRELGEWPSPHDFVVCVFLFMLWVWVCEFTSTRVAFLSSHSWEIVAGFPMKLGWCRFMLSPFGHDRSKNNSKIEFPSQSYVLPKLSPRFCSVVFAFLPQSCELLDFAVCM